MFVGCMIGRAVRNDACRGWGAGWLRSRALGSRFAEPKHSSFEPKPWTCLSSGQPTPTSQRSRPGPTLSCLLHSYTEDYCPAPAGPQSSIHGRLPPHPILLTQHAAVCCTAVPRPITSHLSHGVGAEVDGRALVHLVHGTRVDVGHLHIPATQPALAAGALRVV